MAARPTSLDRPAETADRTAGVGDLVRGWRRRRNLTQHALADRGEVSTRYLSFIETGRARPSRSMVARLGETLAVPLDVRNEMLVAAGYAPLFGERSLDDPELKPVRQALAKVLASHEPYPAFVVDQQTGDEELGALCEELHGYRGIERDPPARGNEDPLTLHRFRLPGRGEEPALFSSQTAEQVSLFDGALVEQCNEIGTCNEHVPYVEAGKPVLNAEYALKKARFCAHDEELGFMGARFNVALNGNRFEPCW